MPMFPIKDLGSGRMAYAPTALRLCLINLGNLDRRLRQSMVFPIRVGVASTDSKNFFITSSFPDRCLRVGGDEVSTSMVFTASSFDVDA